MQASSRAARVLPTASKHARDIVIPRHGRSAGTPARLNLRAPAPLARHFRKFIKSSGHLIYSLNPRLVVNANQHRLAAAGESIARDRDRPSKRRRLPGSWPERALRDDGPRRLWASRRVRRGSRSSISDELSRSRTRHLRVRPPARPGLRRAPVFSRELGALGARF